MTIPANVAKLQIAYPGGTTAIPLSGGDGALYAAAASDLVVTCLLSDGSAVPWVYGTDYSITGDITVGAASLVPSGAQAAGTLTVRRQTPLVQQFTWNEGDGNPSARFGSAEDYDRLIDQEAYERLARAIVIPEYLELTPNTDLPVEFFQGGQMLAWDPVNGKLTTQDPDVTAAQAAAAAAIAAAGQVLSAAWMIIPTMAALRIVTAAAAAASPNALLMSYAGTPNDGARGSFYWNATDTRDDNGGTIVKPNGLAGTDAGRWNRSTLGLADGAYHSGWFGCVADNATDNLSALQALFDAAASTGYNAVYIDPCPNSSINFSTTLTLHPGLVVKGAGRDVSNLKCTTNSLTTFAFQFHIAVGAAGANGPRIYDLSLTGQSGIQFNTIAGGFTDDSSSQGAQEGPQIMRCGIYGVSNNTVGPIGIQMCKCAEAVVQNNTITAFDKMVDFEGCENSRIRDNRMVGASTQFILANYHNTFGNNLVIDANFLAEMVTGGRAFIESSQKTITITNNWMEGGGNYTAIIWLTQTQNGEAIIDNNWGSFGSSYATNFLKVDDNTDGFGGGVGTGYSAIDFNNNGNGGLIGSNGTVNFNSGAGISYFSGPAGFRRKVTHRGNTNSYAEVGWPMNSRDSSNDSIPFMPLVVAYFSPNDDGLNFDGAGLGVKCVDGAFALNVTGSGNCLDFANSDKARPVGTLKQYIFAFSASSSNIHSAITDAGVAGTFTATPLTPIPKWYLVGDPATVTTSGGIQMYFDNTDVRVLAAVLSQ